MLNIPITFLIIGVIDRRPRHRVINHRLGNSRRKDKTMLFGLDFVGIDFDQLWKILGHDRGWAAIMFGLMLLVSPLFAHEAAIARGQYRRIYYLIVSATFTGLGLLFYIFLVDLAFRAYPGLLE